MEKNEQSMVISSNTSILGSIKRNFNYELTDKKAKSSLIKGAKRQNIFTESKQKCQIMTFSIGAFKEIVLPLVKLWEKSKLSTPFENAIIRCKS